jgi:hypothetical protein
MMFTPWNTFEGQTAVFSFKYNILGETCIVRREGFSTVCVNVHRCVLTLPVVLHCERCLFSLRFNAAGLSRNEVRDKKAGEANDASVGRPAPEPTRRMRFKNRCAFESVRAVKAAPRPQKRLFFRIPVSGIIFA